MGLAVRTRGSLPTLRTGETAVGVRPLTLALAFVFAGAFRGARTGAGAALVAFFGAGIDGWVEGATTATFDAFFTGVFALGGAGAFTARGAVFAGGAAVAALFFSAGFASFFLAACAVFAALGPSFFCGLATRPAAEVFFLGWALALAGAVAFVEVLVAGLVAGLSTGAGERLVAVGFSACDARFPLPAPAA